MFRGKKQRVQSTQWTARLAARADSQRPDSQQQIPILKPATEKLSIAGGAKETATNSTHSLDVALRDVEKSSATFQPEEIGIDVTLRLEGPYFSPADPSRYDTVVCLVAGTGISGAIAIAAAFNYAATNTSTAITSLGDTATANAPTRKWSRCVIIWSVKESDDIELPFIEPKADGLELRKYLTGKGRERVDLGHVLAEIVGFKGQSKIAEKVGGEGGGPGGGGRSWCYISGPGKFIEAGKGACLAIKATAVGADLDFYAASWDI